MLFMNGKNLKLHSQAESVEEAWTIFSRNWDHAVDARYLSDQSTYFDIGKEVCPPDSYVSEQAVPNKQEPETYVWRQCCLDAYYRTVCVLEPQYEPRRERYEFGLLWDAGGMTLVTRRQSRP